MFLLSILDFNQLNTSEECRRQKSFVILVLLILFKETMDFQAVHDLLQADLVNSGFEIHPFLVSHHLFIALHLSKQKQIIL